MRCHIRPSRFFLLIIVTGIFIGGCSSHEYVRHLASDACLVTPQKTTKEEIQAYFGPPDQKKSLDGGIEEWTYFQQNQSLLRKTPYIGNKMGTEHYDIMIVTFRGATVDLCQYRMLSEEEFKKADIKAAPRSDAD